MKQKKNILLIPFFILYIFISGCDNTKEAPEPPHAEAALVVELLKALKDRDYILAEKKLQRIKSDDITDVYLENILLRVKNNLLVSRVQELLDDGKIDEAIKCLQERVSVEGESSSLVEALNNLKTLKEIELLVEKISNSKSSRELALNTAKLKRLISTYPPASVLTDYSNKKLNHAREMLVIEKALAIENLKATIDTAWVEGRDYIDSMIASLDIEDSDSPQVIAYTMSMSNNWMDETVTNIYFNPENEFILFRKGMVIADQEEREKLYQSILYLPPNSFKSLLIKAVLLKLAGYSNESGVIAKQIADLLSIPTSKTIEWFKFIPNSLIDINKINPFVKYPFIIYYDERLRKK